MATYVYNLQNFINRIFQQYLHLITRFYKKHLDADNEGFMSLKSRDFYNLENGLFVKFKTFFRNVQKLHFMILKFARNHERIFPTPH